MKGKRLWNHGPHGIHGKRHGTANCFGSGFELS